MTAQKMFESIGWKKVKKPAELEPTFNDHYSNNAIVYEFYHEGDLTCRLYFIDGLYGYAVDNLSAIEVGIKEHQAITKQMEELGWL